MPKEESISTCKRSWRFRRIGPRASGNQRHNEANGCLIFTAPLGLNILVLTGRNAGTISVRISCKRRLLTSLRAGPVDRGPGRMLAVVDAEGEADDAESSAPIFVGVAKQASGRDSFRINFTNKKPISVRYFRERNTE